MTSWYFESQTDHTGTPFATLSNEAYGLWLFAGSWTARADSYGLVTSEFLDKHPHRQEPIDELVEAGIWTVVDAGYRMEYGPSNDFPLPMWRYSATPPTPGKLIEFIPEPDA